MLIWGIRVSSMVLATFGYVCETCGTGAMHQLVKRVRKFTLFFIPLFPVGTRYLDTCTACGRVLQVPREDAEAAAAQAAGHPVGGPGQIGQQVA